MKSQNIKKLTFVIFLLTFTAVFIAIYAFDDNTAPTISYGSDTLTYKEGEDKKDLLADVIAMDKEEGDVTDSIIIETIQVFPDEEFANVIYAAKDSKNNITKKSRKIFYKKSNTDNNTVNANDNASREEDTQDAGTEKDTSTDAEATSNDGSTTDTVQSTDTGDSQTTDNTQGTDITEGSDNTQSAEGADTTADTLTTDLDTEEPLVSTGAPIIRLNSHEIKISSGDYFNPMNYIESAVDDKDDIYRRIQINGKYTNKTPGKYTLEYRASDRDGNMSNVEKLVLIVE